MEIQTLESNKAAQFSYFLGVNNEVKNLISLKHEITRQAVYM